MKLSNIAVVNSTSECSIREYIDYLCLIIQVIQLNQPNNWFSFSVIIMQMLVAMLLILLMGMDLVIQHLYKRTRFNAVLAALYFRV